MDLPHRLQIVVNPMTPESVFAAEALETEIRRRWNAYPALLAFADKVSRACAQCMVHPLGDIVRQELGELVGDALRLLAQARGEPESK